MGWLQDNAGAIAGTMFLPGIGTAFGHGFDKQRGTEAEMADLIAQMPEYQQAQFRDPTFLAQAQAAKAAQAGFREAGFADPTQQVGVRQSTMVGPEAEAAYATALRQQLGISGPADARQSQMDALYRDGNRMLGAAGASLESRGIRGGLATAQKADMVGSQLLPAMAAIESDYARALAADESQRLGLATGFGARAQDLDRFNVGVGANADALNAQMAMQGIGARNQWSQSQAAGWNQNQAQNAQMQQQAAMQNAMTANQMAQFNAQQQAAGAGAYNQWAQNQATAAYGSAMAPYEAQLAQLSGQYGQRGQMLGAGIGAVGNVAGSLVGMGR